MARSGTLATLIGSILEPGRLMSGPRDERPIVDQCRTLMAARGEGPTLRLARSILATYRTLSAEERMGFFRYLADELDVDAAEIAARAEEYREAPGADTLRALQRAAEPRRQTLFRKLNQTDGATAQLVALREDLLAATRAEPDFARIDLDLFHLFSSWFNRGFLVLQRIDWSTPARTLEKIIAYEAVHRINDWDDLRRRTEPDDRRCYAYIHPCMPDDPLIFVEIALTKGVPGTIGEVLAEDRTPLDPAEADTAIFYSISNCQRGLHRISFGESLIKHVVAALSADFPHLRHFVTLSPVPRLRAWAETAEEVDPDLRGRLDTAADAVERGETGPLTELSEELRGLTARYLTQAKRDDGLPLDSVARFHLSNGAELDNVRAPADLSLNGLAQSYGAMANYRYNLREVEANSEAFAAGRTVRVSRRVQGLARAGGGARRPERPDGAAEPEKGERREPSA